MVEAVALTVAGVPRVFALVAIQPAPPIDPGIREPPKPVRQLERRPDLIDVVQARVQVADQERGPRLGRREGEEGIPVPCLCLARNVAIAPARDVRRLEEDARRGEEHGQEALPHAAAMALIRPDHPGWPSLRRAAAFP